MCRKPTREHTSPAVMDFPVPDHRRKAELKRGEREVHEDHITSPGVPVIKMFGLVLSRPLPALADAPFMVLLVEFFAQHTCVTQLCESEPDFIYLFRNSAKLALRVQLWCQVKTRELLIARRGTAPSENAADET